MFASLRFFFRYGWRFDKAYVIERILFQLTNAFVPLAAALLPKFIIDELMGSRRMDRLILLIVFFAGFVFVAAAVSDYLDKDSFSHRLKVDAAFGLYLHEMQARADYASLEDPEYLDLKRKAEKFITCDYHGFGYLLDCALNILGQCVTLLTLSAVLFRLSGWLVLLFAFMALIGSLAESIAKKQAMALYDRIVRSSRGWQYYAGLFGDSRCGKEIRLNRIAGWLLKREQRFLNDTIRDMKRQNDCYIRSGIIGAACSFVQQAAAYAWLCVCVLQGRIGIGDFAMYTAAVTAFGAALRTLMGNTVELRNYDRYFDDVDRYLHLPAKLREGPRRPLPQGPHRLEFRDVGFRYPGQETWALRHVNLTLEPGEKLSVVGENGAGKTTFVKLLTRLYDVTEGEILLDGTDIRTLDPDAYMGLFGTVFQDFRLFSFSLKDNVALDRPCTDGETLKLLEKAGLGERVGTLADGIGTYVNREFDEHGFEPSGGEAQKIALARALCGNAPVMVLDEPTAALDPRAEHDLYMRFAELTKGKTAVFISHRLSSAQFCDRIAVFSAGQVAEYGTHRELTDRNGIYAELYRLQAQFYAEG